MHRGFEVAESHGCFTCHGVGGHRGMANPGHGLEDIPPWSGGLITMYADNEAEIREWIQDGMPKRVRADPEQMKLRARVPPSRCRPSGTVLSERRARRGRGLRQGGGGLREAGGREGRGGPAGRRSSTAASTATAPRAAAPSTIPARSRATCRPGTGPTTRSSCAATTRRGSGSSTAVLARLQDNPLARFFLDRQKVADARVPAAPDRGRRRRAPGLHPLAPAAPVLSPHSLSPAVTAGEGRGTVRAHARHDRVGAGQARPIRPSPSSIRPRPESASSWAKPSTSFETRLRRTRSSCARWAGSWWSPSLGLAPASAGSTRAPPASST